ncbi:hypothetical protein IWZ01DRAFT_174779 [Phyllosticta capitalensis]
MRNGERKSKGTTELRAKYGSVVILLLRVCRASEVLLCTINSSKVVESQSAARYPRAEIAELGPFQSLSTRLLSVLHDA